ncbi:DUF3089 domain-containing protein [Baekduia soli]|uniref:DUF3089 domain-containing protein n=1 Tax=Baekduia soli TaxID=496014 RepID=A0A5B8U993_9ACTN|nr:DUF3089 domain-containing protein [Baekduia soli]QEC49358.1 DUF3089 domain-containing protein [Baekduia soli]
MTQGPRRRRTAAAMIATACAAVALGGAGAGGASATTWLCAPGHAGDPCTAGLSTTLADATGATLGTITPPATKAPMIDCFYVYPTVSDQKAPTASLRIDPEQRSIALYQAARYASECRVWAPMYRQITLQGLLQPKTVTKAMQERAYGDVRAAWRDYLAHHNRGRGLVLIGHSQGSFMLRRLVAREIDPKPSVRRRMVSAILLGGNVLVRKGGGVGGDFGHIPACRSATQLGCVIAFSTFNATPPAGALFGRVTGRGFFGRTSTKDLQVLCTNPAALGGGSGLLTSIEPAAPFAPGTIIGAETTQIGLPAPAASTTWVQFDGVYRAACSAAGGAHVLRITGAVPGAPVLRPLADATWGLHLTDANIGLGNLVGIVHREAAAYARR